VNGGFGRLPEGLEDLFLGNLVPDPFVQLGQERPMQAGAFVVGGVEPEVSPTPIKPQSGSFISRR
jgi:hypothetical protein